MAANLYIHPTSIKLLGYPNHFRDQYNYSSVFWSMDLSWWKLVRPMLNKENFLPIENCEKLLRIINQSEIDLENNYSERQKKAAQRFECFNKEYMENKKVELIDFLELSIESRIMLDCYL